MKSRLFSHKTVQISVGVFILLSVSCKIETKAEKEIIEHQQKYFSKLTGIISPYMDYNPRGEMHKDSIKDRSHYQFSYDANGRVLEIEYFNKQGKSNDSYFGMHKVVYSYFPDSLVRRYYDAEGQKGNMSRHYYGGGNIHKEKFSTDSKGLKSALALKDTSNISVANGFGTFRYSWITNADGSFEQNQYKKDGSRNILTEYFPFHKSLITVDDKGHLHSITNLDTINNSAQLNHAAGYAKVIFDFDAYGNEMGWEFQDLDGNLANRKSVFAMEHDYAKVVYDFTWKNKKLGESSAFSMNFLDTDGNPTVSNEGIHQTSYQFNGKQDITLMEFYGENQERVVHPANGYHKILVSYDSDGNRTGVIRMDAQEKIIE
ncbi:hypothetical protein J0X14_08315 [Muricauda sp. CAU 1633]|uniref:hypothetical protein n=1 Tax=Allomuricauda sp. CAU 1633 TaxID=2816036 RepID=UPI001A8FA015|nr:hypothetical protein [Muricauda sp. CAU 1633]MBO0322296.1 hypothetical protein [Muricauda sp. CAU 1633]